MRIVFTLLAAISVIAACDDGDGAASTGDCTTNTDCLVTEQCLGLACHPADQQCVCEHSTAGVVAMSECSFWGLPETRDMADPRSPSEAPFSATRADYAIVCQMLRGVGEICSAGAECASGLCAGFCTQDCSAEPCPDGYECVAASGGAMVCVPDGF